VQHARAMNEELEYTGLMAQAWDIDGLEISPDIFDILRGRDGVVVARERKARSPAVRQSARPDDRIVTTLARRPGSP